APLTEALRVDDYLYRMAMEDPRAGIILNAYPHFARHVASNRELARLFHLQPRNYSLMSTDPRVENLGYETSHTARAFADGEPAAFMLLEPEAG
ncbi:hypothetical protein NGM37_29695, partial [Streptomyces sp. TRM76130]|nr:hypothetical protein [Streptomyces sp. TRM76130]